MSWVRIPTGVLFAALALGCGGTNLQTGVLPAPGFYRGTFNFMGYLTMPPETAPMIVDMQANGEFEAHGGGGAVAVSAINWPGEGNDIISINSQIIVGTITLERIGGVVTFSFRINTGDILANGPMAPSPLPSLGSLVSVPPAGDYRGELVVIGNGRARAFGTVAATIDERGQWSGVITGGGGWVNSALFTGRLLPSGSLMNAVLSTGSQVAVQESAQYSFDGTTLIVRFDQLFLIPGTAWFTLQRV